MRFRGIEAHSPIESWNLGQQPPGDAELPGADELFAPANPIRMGDRQQLLAGLESNRSESERVRLEREWGELHHRAYDLATGPGGRQVFELDREPPKTRDHYGRHPLGQNLLLARRLVEAGASCITVSGWVGPSPDRDGGASGISSWDMHGGHMGMGNAFGTGSYGMSWCLPRLDEALAAPIEDLQDRGLLERTLVVVIGEFGRSPKIQTQGAPGRVHWPDCFSALLAGGGISGGAAYGDFGQDRGLCERTAGPTPGPRRHHLPRSWSLTRHAPGPGQRHPTSHYRRRADPGTVLDPPLFVVLLIAL